MRHTMQKTGRLLAALALSGVLLASGLMAQAAPAPQPGSKGLELEVTEMDLEITEEDPRPRAYLYTGSSSDYYFIVWMSSNPTVATVDGDGKVTGRSRGYRDHYGHLRPRGPGSLQGDGDQGERGGRGQKAGSGSEQPELCPEIR